MFLLLKILDRSAWDKKLSFLGKLGLVLPTSFDRFVLDTRYTINLIYLTFFVALVGVFAFFIFCWLFKIEEMAVFTKMALRIKKVRLPRGQKGKEAITVESKKA